MKKIMFNDKYGLTTAVLNGSKTQTRRICNPIPYRRELTCNDVWGHYPTKEEIDFDKLLAKSKYSIGEVVAIAQCYSKIMDYYHSLGKVSERKVSEQELIFWNAMRIMESTGDDSAMRGDDNKMFVKADLMPHHIKIANIRIERLQDISDDDCMKEGIISEDMLTPRMEDVTRYYFDGSFVHGEFRTYSTPREAYAALIDKVSGKGTWDKNLWVFVYDYILVD